jgi:spore maturation protein CgeB
VATGGDVPRAMLVGQFSPGALENSYCRALEELGWQVVRFDIIESIQGHVRLGRAGRFFNLFVPVEPWIRKSSRDLMLRVLDLQPDLIVTFGHYPVRVGALAQIRSSSPAKLVHIWPDPMVNWTTHLTVCLPLYDLLATYSRATVPVFRDLGIDAVAWIPLAGDPALHPKLEGNQADRSEFAAEVSFIGAWRPEREVILSQLGGFDLKIWGPDWGRRCRQNRAIMKAWQGRALYGLDFAKAVSGSKVNLNIVDPGNYPAANMRFFELSTAGGFQVSSACPEMMEYFRHGEQIYYYRQSEELQRIIAAVLADNKLRERVAVAAHQKVHAEHTYTHRARALLRHLDLDTSEEES